MATTAVLAPLAAKEPLAPLATTAPPEESAPPAPLALTEAVESSPLWP